MTPCPLASPDNGAVILLFLGAAALNAAFLTSVRGWGLTAFQSLITVNGINLLIYIPLWWLALPSNLAATPWPEILLQAVYQGIVAAFIASIPDRPCGPDAGGHAAIRDDVGRPGCGRADCDSGAG